MKALQSFRRSPPCPICEAGTLGFGREGGRPLRLCPACRHIFWGAFPGRAVLRKFYQAGYTAQHQQPVASPEAIAYYRGHVAELAALAGKDVAELAIADIGSSYPLLLEQAVQMGCGHAIAVDWSFEGQAYAATHQVRMLDPDAFEAQAPEHSLDVLRYSHVLEHTPDPARLLAAHLRKLRPGGVVYITQPNTPVLRPQASGVVPRDCIWPNHLHFFSPLSLQRLAERCGVVIERLFTVEGDEAALARYEGALDLDYAAEQMRGVRERGEDNRGPLNNYPTYAGESATLYGRKPAPPGVGDLDPSTEPASEERPVPDPEPFWLSTLLADPECKPIVAALADCPADALLVCDERSLEALRQALALQGVESGRMTSQRTASVALAKDFDIRRLVVVDAEDEEAARDRLLVQLRHDGFPPPILQGLEVSTFVADFLAAQASRKPIAEIRSRRFRAEADPPIYAIVNIPRAGSTFLGGLLESVGLGDPFEHVRPWLVRLLQQRPRHLFNGVRFVRNILHHGQVGGVFGTKLISHFIREIVPELDAAEREYLSGIAAAAGIVYLYRTSKLDQAVSEKRAAVSGAWHAGDPATKTSLPAGALGEDFGHLQFRTDALAEEERRLARLLTALPRLCLVDYDELSEEPEAVCRRLAQELALPIRGDVSSRYVKLADASSEALRAAFLRSHPEYRTRGDLTGPQALQDARAEQQAALADLDARAERIRTGHAKTRHGDYQDRHYYLVDYDHQWLPGIDFMFRGPVPQRMEAGDYIAYLGASQTLGAFVARPFSAQIGERLGIEPLNLGRGGAGPAHFLRSPTVREWIANARALVVQAMSARMSDTELFRSREGRAGGWLLDPTGRNPERVAESEEAWSTLFEHGSPEDIDRVVAQARREWVSSMQQLAALATGPSLLVWMSGRQPAYAADPTSREQMLNQFPELIDRPTFDAAGAAFSAKVEVVAHQSEPEPTVSAFSGERLPVVFGGGTLELQTVEIHNLYYPGQAAHDAVAEAVTPVLDELLRQRPRRLSAGRA